MFYRGLKGYLSLNEKDICVFVNSILLLREFDTDIFLW